MMSCKYADDARRHLPLSELSFHLLLSLGNGSSHGYAIGKEIEQRTAGRLNPSTGALYQALKRLRDDGLLEPDVEATARAEDARRRYFRLTDLGRRVVALEADRLEQLLTTAREKNLHPTSG